MVGGVPLFLAFVPLKHGKVRDPQESEVFRCIATLLEKTVALGILLGERNAQQAGRRIDRELAGRHLAVGRKRSLLAGLRRPGNDDEQVSGVRAGFSRDLCCGVGKVLFDALEVLKYLGTALRNEKRFDAVAFGAREFAYAWDANRDHGQI